MPTLRARPAAICGVHHRDDDARPRSLVLDKASQLGERPSGKPCLRVPAPSRDPSAYAFEILKGYAASSAFGGLDQRLADAMVLVPAEAGFFARQPPQLLLRPSRPLALEPGSLERVLSTVRLNGVAAVDFPVAVDGEIDDAKINSDDIANWLRLSDNLLDLDVDVIAAAGAFDERRRRRLLASQAFPLKIAERCGDPDSAAKKSNAEKPFLL